jgi:hypothetical protein
MQIAVNRMADSRSSHYSIVSSSGITCLDAMANFAQDGLDDLVANLPDSNGELDQDQHSDEDPFDVGVLIRSLKHTRHQSRMHRLKFDGSGASTRERSQKSPLQLDSSCG